MPSLLEQTRIDAEVTAPARTSTTASVLVTVGGIVGIAVLVCVASGWVFGMSVLVFTTGSMAPSMPTGTAAIVQHVDASSVVVGDVVTVPRPGEALPVTHRVESIGLVADDASARSLVLKGDANDSADREPYVVRAVERVLVAVPGGAAALSVLRSPAVIGITAGLVAMAIVWSFWPRERRPFESHESADPSSGSPSMTAP
ncbi:signal peptidase I [Labedella phragmitis]|uniref:Signal peptidase I n=1 Tax=Labedella phragmitis TaxID=2498849 RepID=A0A444PNZ4_9MICO|nr:signal peptidase I [Labedella phragmitis]